MLDYAIAFDSESYSMQLFQLTLSKAKHKTTRQDRKVI